MAAIKLANFRGLAPIIASELLPDTGAQEAINCVLDSGDIEPLLGGKFVFAIPSPNITKSIFRIGDNDSSAIWLTWDKDVVCVQSPTIELGRYYYTGDGEPRVTTAALATSGGGNYPSQSRVMGIPKPITAPTVTVSGGTLTDVSRYYCYTFVDDWGQESAPSPVSSLITGKPDGIWTISGMNDAPPNNGSIINLTYVGNIVTITSNVIHFNRIGEQIKVSGITTVTNINGIWTLIFANAISKTMVFKVSNTPSGVFNSAIDSTASWSRVSLFGTCTKRLYRTSGTTAQFQLVADNIVGSTYVDTLSDGNILGDELISGSWEMPPTNLKLIGVHPCGSLIGFVGNELRASEPYQPHAWPKEYSIKVEYPIVAGAIYSNNIVVGTTGFSYTIYGSSPEQFTLIKHNVAYPCISTRGMVSIGNGVVYVSSDGLVQVSDNGIDLLTANLYSRKQWQELNPNSMIGAYAKGTLYYLTNNNLLMFSNTHVVASIPATSIHVSPQNGKLYYVISNTIYAFNESSLYFLLSVWKSKDFYFQEPKTFTAAKVLFDPIVKSSNIDTTAILAANQNLITNNATFGEINASTINTYPLNDDALLTINDILIINSDGHFVTSIRPNEVRFELYADKKLKYITIVSDNKPFRLPSGYRASRYSVRVLSICRIKAIELAENPIELKNA